MKDPLKSARERGASGIISPCDYNQRHPNDGARIKLDAKHLSFYLRNAAKQQQKQDISEGLNHGSAPFTAVGGGKKRCVGAKQMIRAGDGVVSSQNSSDLGMIE